MKRVEGTLIDEARIRYDQEETWQDPETDCGVTGSICQGGPQLRAGIAENPGPCGKADIFSSFQFSEGCEHAESLLGSNGMPGSPEKEMSGVGIQARDLVLVY